MPRAPAVRCPEKPGDDGEDADWDDDEGDAQPSIPQNAPAKAERGAVRLEGASVEGGLDETVIRRRIGEKRAAVLRCYERELESNRDLKGTVRVVFTIQRDGSVRDVSATGVAEMRSCVGRVVSSISFPKPQGGTVIVRYPFVFSAVK